MTQLQRQGRKPDGPGWFGVTVWNLHARGLTFRELRPHRQRLVDELRAGVTVFLLAEAMGSAVDQLLDQLGLQHRLARPTIAPTVPAAVAQTRVAWDPKRWRYLKHRTVQLNQTPWFARGGDGAIYSWMITVTLVDVETGERVTFGSYHTAPRVQVPPKLRPWRRFAALREAAKSWRAVARSAARVVLGGDSNVDVDVATGGPWRFLRRAMTGLRIVATQRGTLDGSRRAIDQLRVKGVDVAPSSAVIETDASDHHIVRRWLRARR